MGKNEINKSKYIDPEPSERGLLLSDRILDYVNSYNLLIDQKDFCLENLKPASYSLALGKSYYYNGKFYKLKDDEPLRLPPNSYVVVSTRETIRLPHYIAGRFGLRVKFVYEGLLVGSGPQVDPGFEGILGCPLHNLTDEEVEIQPRENFAWIDFVKTTPFGDNSSYTDDEALLTAVKESIKEDKNAILGHNGNETQLYKTSRLTIADSLPAGKKVMSSLWGLEQDIREVQAEMNHLRRVGAFIEVGAVIGVLLLMFTLWHSLWGNRESILRLEEQVNILKTSVEQKIDENPASSSNIPRENTQTKEVQTPEKSRRNKAKE